MNTLGIYLVRVTTLEGQHHVWAAATPRDEAVNRVLEVAPPRCSAHLLDEHLKPRQDVVMNMTPGEVRDLSK